MLAGCPQAKTDAKGKVDAPKETVYFLRPVSQTVEEYEEFPGRTWAKNTIEVRARVTGHLKSVNFKDGGIVRPGDLLAEIDPEPFQAGLASAQAAIDQSTARHKKLVKQEKRASELLQSGVKAITDEEYESIVADKEDAFAAIAAAKAAHKIAQLNLGYTDVRVPRAPFARDEGDPKADDVEGESKEKPPVGHISRRLVDPGNLVVADTTVLATVVIDDPIYVYFDLDENTVIRLKRLAGDGQIELEGDPSKPQLKVRIALTDEDKFDHIGTVNFVDNQLDPTTGTLRCRATVRNDNGFFSPGMFVRMRFPIGGKHSALLVPEESLMTDQGQRTVYVINEKDEVESRRVTTGILVDGLRVIRQGLGPEDRVVATGLQRIKKKTPVQPEPWPSQTEDPAKTVALEKH